MKDGIRFVVGVLVLGIGIYVSLQYPSGDQAAPSETASNIESMMDSIVPESTFDEQWQKPALKKPGAVATSPEVAVPKFDEVTRPASTANPGEFDRPPVITDQYRPLLPFRIAGSDSPESRLVPVQPKPRVARPHTGPFQFHQVRDGDTLQSIASEYFGSADRYLEIFAANRDVLSEPTYLPRGVKLKIPAK